MKTKLKIPVVFAMNNRGAAPNYTIEALNRLGHETRRMTPDEYFSSNPNEYDLFFCQDSGEGIDFRRASDAHIAKSSMWYWDCRWNRIQRNPGDDDMAQYVSDRNGWVFVAQSPDVDRLSRERHLARMSWLPIAGDPYLWNIGPKEEKKYNWSFVGNCYDPGRGAALQKARDHGVYWPGPNSVFDVDAATIYRQSYVVFTVPTFYNLPHDVTHTRVDWDLTMRPYEAYCCGIPLVSSPIPDFEITGFNKFLGKGLYIFNNIDEIPDVLDRAYEDAVKFGDEMAYALRKFIIENHTYEKRMLTAFERLESAGVLK